MAHAPEVALMTYQPTRNGGIFTFTSDLARKLRRYINAYSKNAKPFRWRYSATSRRIRHENVSSATVQ